MIKDWLFSDESGICHFRTAGILIRGNKILLQKHGDEYAVPGGHVSFGEASEAALVREFKEELGADVSCERLLWVEENFWNWGSKKAHNISFYYLISLADSTNIAEVSQDNKNVSFHWVSFDELKQLTVYPQFIKDEIGDIFGGVKHFVRNDW